MARALKTCPSGEVFALVLVFAAVLSVNLTAGKNVAAEKPTSIPQSPPQFVEELAKPNVTTEVRQNAKLYCPFVGPGSIIYEWYKGEDRIQKGLGGWDRFGPDGGKSITIRSVTPQDAGIYKCRAVNGFGSRYYSIELFVSGKNSLELNVLKPRPPKSEDYQDGERIPQISIVNMPRAATIKEFRGKNVMVLCEASGNPKPEVTWFKDGRNVTVPSESASKLHLLNITDKDNGRYKCEARNVVGADEFEVGIEVAEAYLGTVEVKGVNPSNLTLVVGQSGNITCVAGVQGPATPFVVWVKKVESQTSESDSQDKLVEHEGNYYKYINRTGTEVSHIRNNLYSTTLTFFNATYDDAGTYHCAAVGPTGINNHVVHVFVKEDLEKAAIRENQKSSSVQRAILLAFAFLILAGIIGACLVRLYGCRGPLKKPQKVNNISRRLPVLRPSIGTTTTTTTATANLPKRSPGETMSTSLTTSHHPTDVLQPLVSPASYDGGRNSHQTVSTAISAPRNHPSTTSVPRPNFSKSRTQAGVSHSKYIASQRHNNNNNGKRPSQLGPGGRCHQKQPKYSSSSSDSEETSVSKFMPHPSPSLASSVVEDGTLARYLVNSVNCDSPQCCPQGCCCDDNLVDSHGGHQHQDLHDVSATTERKSRRSRFNQHHHHYHHHHHNVFQPIDPALSTSDTCIPPVPAPSSTCSSISFPSSAYSSGSSHAQCTRDGFRYYRNSHKNHHQQPPSTFSSKSDRLLNDESTMCKYCNS